MNARAALTLFSMFPVLAGCSEIFWKGPEPVSVTGAVTFNGEPAVGKVKLTDAISAFGNVEIERFSGTYRVEAQLTYCGETRVTVSVSDSIGYVLASETRRLGSCGDHLADFELFCGWWVRSGHPECAVTP